MCIRDRHEVTYVHDVEEEWNNVETVVKKRAIEAFDKKRKTIFKYKKSLQNPTEKRQVYCEKKSDQVM